MSEFSLSSISTKKTHHFSSLLISDLFLFCSFIFSHPLYFLYFIFFSPYLLKFLSFLSPLFITTSLLLLTLLTFSPTLVNDISHSELSGTYQSLIEKLRSKLEDGYGEVYEFEELEAFSIVFDTSILEIEENPVGILGMEDKEKCFEGGEETEDQKQSTCSVLQNDYVSAHGNLVPESGQVIAGNQEKRLLGGFLDQKEVEEEVKEVNPLSVKTNKVKEEADMRKVSKVSGDNGGEDKYYAPKHNCSRTDEAFWSPDNGGDYNSSKGTIAYSNLGSFGSMRKEKEWRRTLACKLFEERHNANGGEGMDSLWETYETDSIKVQNGKSKSKKWKKGSSFGDHEEEEEEEERDDGNLCCLQALKFSAGKMNLGMGRPSLVKISKALKGIGWLHHVNKSGKKGYH